MRTLPNIGLHGDIEIGSDGWGPGYNADMLKLSVLVQSGADGIGAVLPVGTEEALDGTVFITTGDNKINVRDEGAWASFTPEAGWWVYDRASMGYLSFDGSTWTAFKSGGGSASYPPLDGNAGKTLAVNQAEDGVEWVAQSGGGSGGVRINGDLSKGVPLLSELETLNAGPYVFSEKAGKAINVKMPDANGGLRLGGLLLAGYTPAEDFHVAVFVVPNMDSRNYHGASIGFRDTATGKMLAFTNVIAGGYTGYSLQRWNNENSRVDQDETGVSNRGWFPHWLHAKWSVAAGKFFFGTSNDGANPVWYYHPNNNNAPGLDWVGGTFNRFFFGMFDQTDFRFGSATFFCVDGDGDNREMG